MLYLYDENNTLIGTFESQSEAARKTQIPRTTVQSALYNKSRLRAGPYKGYMFTEDKLHDHQYPKIFIFDIETAALRGYIWARFKQNIYSDQLISDWFMLTWAGKFLNEPEIYSDRICTKDVLEENDGKIVTSLWKKINEADVIIAHNLEKFDRRKMNSRFIVNGLNPPSLYRTIDTYKEAKKHFGFSSNRLNELARVFGIGSKIKTEFKLWDRCAKGEKDALEEMERYNKKDVELLEEVYLKFRPWIKSCPNLALYMDGDRERCSNCGSDDIIETNTYYYTNCGKYDSVRCGNCGAPLRRRKNALTKEEKENLLVSPAR